MRCILILIGYRPYESPLLLSIDNAFSPDTFTLELEFKMTSLVNTSRTMPYFHSRETPSLWLIKEWLDSANRSKSVLLPLSSSTTAADGSLVFIRRVSPASKVSRPAIRGINDANIAWSEFRFPEVFRIINVNFNFILHLHLKLQY